MSLYDTREIDKVKIVMMKGQDGANAYTAGTGININNNVIHNTEPGARAGVVDSISSGYAHTEIILNTNETFKAGELIVLKSETTGTAQTLRIQYSASVSSVRNLNFYDTSGNTTTVDFENGDIVTVMLDVTGYRAVVLGISGGNKSLALIGTGKETSYSNDIIDTDIYIHRAPKDGDRLLLKMTHTVTSQPQIKVYDENNGAAYTLSFAFWSSFMSLKGLCLLEIYNDVMGLKLNILYTFNGIEYSAGTGINILNGYISNTMPQLGLNTGYKEVESVSSGYLGTVNGDADYFIMNMKTNATPDSTTHKYTMMLSFGMRMEYALLKDRDGNDFSRYLYSGMVLLCKKESSGTGTEQDPVLITVVSIINWYVEAGRKANTTIGEQSTAEGHDNTASGQFAHAEGSHTVASGNRAHAEGNTSTASGLESHAEGYQTTADGDYSHAEGNHTHASGDSSHAEGDGAQAVGDYSHAGGIGTIASYEAMTAIGKFNTSNTYGMLLEIGNGEDASHRANAFTVNNDGDAVASHNIVAGNDVIDGNGYRMSTAVNAAHKLLSDVPVAESVPYLYRRSGGAVRNVALEKLKKIIGASVAWNQHNNATDNYTENGITFKATSNGVMKITGDMASANASKWTYNNIIRALAGHKVLVMLKDTPTGVRLNNVGSQSTIIIANENYSYGFFVESGTANVNYESYVGIFDLTQAFGSTIADYLYSLETATAGSGIAKLKEWGFFTKDHYAYNTGALQSVWISGNGKKCVGFNQWDEEWESGYWDDDGVKKSNDNCIRSKNYIPIIPNTAYNVTPPPNATTRGVTFRVLDSNKNIINSVSGITAPRVINIPQNGYYAVFSTAALDAISTYNNDICINISDTSRNGQYEPYTEKTYPLYGAEFRGLFKLDSNNNLYADGDEYTPDGNVKRKYGIVDLGSLEWSRDTTTRPADGATIHAFYASLPTAKKVPSATSDAGNVICAEYTTTNTREVDYGGYNSVKDKLCGGADVNGRVWIYNSAYNDYTGTQFTTAMSGVYLIYELATPTTENRTPYEEIMPVDGDGTEEFLDYRSVPIPVGHESEYWQEVVGLPETPTTDGTYKLICTVSNGVPTFSWAAN